MMIYTISIETFRSWYVRIHYSI